MSEQDKKLAADWFKRIDTALERHKDVFKTFERNRRLLRGLSDPDNEKSPKIRANLYFANLATMRPQVYAKDPEFSVVPSDAVPTAKVEAVKKFGQAAEAVLKKVLVQDAKLKKRAKRLLNSTYTTSVGWWKCVWQEDKKRDPLIENQLKDTQDNLERMQAQRTALDDPRAGGDMDLELAKLRETIAGLEAQAEVTVARGAALDFVLSEDILILDQSVRELGDYTRSSAIAHRVWMTAEKYRETFGYAPKGRKTFIEKAGTISAGQDSNKASELLCAWEIWEQATNRVFHVCDGEEGFCREPSSPDWTGRRWYPFFGIAFNEIDGTFYPLSDVELTEPLVVEYNKSRDDLVKDRADARPINVVREGGTLTPEDLQKIRNRSGADLIVVKGVGNNPLSNDIFQGALATIKPEIYDTSPARADIEQIIGGGDASRGTILKAKTATEAEILSQGLRSRSGERQDTMEDLLTEVGEYVLQACLRKLTPQEVARIAGEEAAAAWPSLSADEVFEMVQVQVKGGSTGKPDRLQEQDRWTKLLPVIEKCIEQVSKLRSEGQDQLAQALIQLTRETLRRFEEKLDIEQYLPPPAQDGQPDPVQLATENQALKAQMQELLTKLQDLSTKVEKAYISAAASVATSANPLQAAQAFAVSLQALEAIESGEQPSLAGMPNPPPPSPPTGASDAGNPPAPGEQPPQPQ